MSQGTTDDPPPPAAEHRDEDSSQSDSIRSKNPFRIFRSVWSNIKERLPDDFQTVKTTLQANHRQFLRSVARGVLILTPTVRAGTALFQWRPDVSPALDAFYWRVILPIVTTGKPEYKHYSGLAVRSDWSMDDYAWYTSEQHRRRQRRRPLDVLCFLGTVYVAVIAIQSIYRWIYDGGTIGRPTHILRTVVSGFGISYIHKYHFESVRNAFRSMAFPHIKKTYENHPHGLEANKRSVARTFAQMVTCMAGYRPFFVQTSSKDDREGHPGERTPFWAKDEAQVPRRDEKPPNTVDVISTWTAISICLLFYHR